MTENEKYMKACLKLAKRGYGKTAPNPMVGCIILKGRKIIGRGYHGYYGGPHAEISAIRNAKSGCRNATMYVNLEPCCHTGKKTPPCLPAIVRSGVKKVVIAMKDPNPKVAGRGIRQLKKNHIKTETGVLEQEALELNKAYVKWITGKMPYVLLKSAMTLDGKIASVTGASRWITSRDSIEYSRNLRKQYNAILVGVGTVIRDNPSLTTHAKHGDGFNPVRVVIDPDLRIPLNSRVLDRKAPKIIVTANRILKDKLEYLAKKGANIISINKNRFGHISFMEIMKKLAETGIYSVIIEGGGITNSRALESGVVDEILFFVAPKILGGADARTPVEGKGIQKLSEALNISNMQARVIGSDIMISGRIVQ